jgi:hypothetical protein
LRLNHTDAVDKHQHEIGACCQLPMRAQVTETT